MIFWFDFLIWKSEQSEKEKGAKAVWYFFPKNGFETGKTTLRSSVACPCSGVPQGAPLGPGPHSEI